MKKSQDFNQIDKGGKQRLVELKLARTKNKKQITQVLTWAKTKNLFAYPGSSANPLMAPELYTAAEVEQAWKEFLISEVDGCKTLGQALRVAGVKTINGDDYVMVDLTYLGLISINSNIVVDNERLLDNRWATQQWKVKFLVSYLLDIIREEGVNSFQFVLMTKANDGENAEDIDIVDFDNFNDLNNIYIID